MNHSDRNFDQPPPFISTRDDSPQERTSDPKGLTGGNIIMSSQSNEDPSKVENSSSVNTAGNIIEEKVASNKIISGIKKHHRAAMDDDETKSNDDGNKRMKQQQLRDSTTTTAVMLMDRVDFISHLLLDNQICPDEEKRNMVRINVSFDTAARRRTQIETTTPLVFEGRDALLEAAQDAVMKNDLEALKTILLKLRSDEKDNKLQEDGISTSNDHSIASAAFDTMASAATAAASKGDNTKDTLTTKQQQQQKIQQFHGKLLLQACRQGHTEIIGFLLGGGDGSDSRGYHYCLPNIYDEDGKTPLHHACCCDGRTTNDVILSSSLSEQQQQQQQQQQRYIKMEEIIILLLDKYNCWSQLCLSDRSGKTPLEYLNETTWKNLYENFLSKQQLQRKKLDHDHEIAIFPN